MLDTIAVAHVVIAAIGLANTAVLLAIAVVSRKKIVEVHALVNSRLTELLTLTAKASRAEGKADAMRVQVDP